MKIFPSTHKKFKLFDSQIETLSRLNRRTKHSKKLISSNTDKSFIGVVNKDEFKIISSSVGKGAFCVLKGNINSTHGRVDVEIHKVFKVLCSVILCFPIIGFLVILLTDAEDFSPIFLLVVPLHILLIRYFFIGLAYKFLCSRSLDKLRDVLDVEWID